MTAERDPLLLPVPQHVALDHLYCTAIKVFVCVCVCLLCLCVWVRGGVAWHGMQPVCVSSVCVCDASICMCVACICSLIMVRVYVYVRSPVINSRGACVRVCVWH